MTTTFILAPGEELLQCPYNTAHQITNARLLTHLDKCRKAYIKDLTAEGRKKYMKICRHNAMHHIPAPELRFHEERCVDAFAVVRHLSYHNSEEGERKYEESRRRESDRDRHDHGSGRDSHSHHHSSSRSSKKQSSSSSSRPETKPVTTNDYGLEEEDWEADSAGYAAGYDPEKKLKHEVIMYNPAGLTKSERKKFRNEVRQKAQEKILKGEPVELPTASTFEVKPNITNLKIKEEGKSLEPGEIEDDNDDETQEDNNSPGTSGHSEDCRNSNDQNSKTSSRPQYSSGYSRSNSGYSRSSWTNRAGRTRTREEYDDDYTDSDDFEGFDPYC